MSRWYLYENEEVIGPFYKADLSGRIDPETLVCRAGEEEWNPAQSVPELNNLVSNDQSDSPETGSQDQSQQGNQHREEIDETQSDKNIEPIDPTLCNLRQICETASDRNLRYEYEKHQEDYDEKELELIRAELERRDLLSET